MRSRGRRLSFQVSVKEFGKKNVELVIAVSFFASSPTALEVIFVDDGTLLALPSILDMNERSFWLRLIKFDLSYIP